MFKLFKGINKINFAHAAKGLLCCENCSKTFSFSGMKALELEKCPYCSELNFIPMNIKNYCIFKPLGGGGYGKVFKAWNYEKREYVAIKTHKETIEYHNNKGIDVSSMLSIEYMILTAVQPHHNISKVYELFEHENRTYLVVEFIEGVRLDKLVTYDGDLPDHKLVVFWAKQILSALQHMYEKGWLYRDIKPHNIIITQDDYVKIIDFGLAMKLDELRNGAGKIEGSICFNVSPERLRLEPEDMPSEIYALGMLMFFCLTGKPFYKADNVETLIKLIKTPRKINSLYGKMSNVKRDLVDIVGKMIRQDAADRYQSYDEVIVALEYEFKYYTSNRTDLHKIIRY